MSCRLCGYDKSSVIYDGPIRGGGIGSEPLNGYKVHSCNSCEFVYLSPVPEKLDTFYESPEYRSQWDYAFSPEDIHKKYDHEQNDRITRVGVQNIRGRVVIDLGASAGVFLDVVQSLASKTVAVEPGAMYKNYLTGRGHVYYSYPEDAIQAGEKADLVTSFDVIEHISNPKALIEAAFELLKSHGIFVLSMPNFNDLIKVCHKQAFDPFYFQVAHLNYFSADVIPTLFARTGFTNIRIDYLHKYGIENLVRWMKYASPGNVEEIDGLFDRTFNAHYRAEIERLGIASHLFITAIKNVL